MRHGTIAAYWKHHRSDTTPCPACKKAWSQYVSERRKLNKPARPSNFVNTETRAMDRLLAEKPPRITWRKKSNGIWVHTSINDPHADTGYRLNKEIA